MTPILRFFLLLPLVFFHAGAARAAPAAVSDMPPLGVATYGVYWEGVRIAGMRAEISAASMRVDIDSYGIVKEISGYRSRTRTDFAERKGGRRPSAFHTVFRRKGKDKTIDLRYDPATGAVVHDEVVPPDNRLKRPAVGQEGKDKAVDPLTAVLLARQTLRQYLKSGKRHFTFDLYDGRRLSWLGFEIAGRATVRVRGEDRKAVVLVFRRRALEGHTSRELERMKREEPVVTVYVSDDDALMPLLAEGKAPLGTAYIRYEGTCAAGEGC
jgi:hypothetical protein